MWRWAAAAAVLLILGVGDVHGKGKVAEPPSAIVWPPSPAQARLAYSNSISGPMDAGSHVSTFGRIANWITGAKRGKEELIKPFGVAFDEDNNLCVTDTGAGVVCFFDRARRKWQRWDKLAKVKLQSPVSIARRNGVFYVADTGLGKVLAFRKPEHIEFEMTQGLQRPAGLTIAGQRLYVVDSLEHRVCVFDLQGKPQFQFGKRGLGRGEFNFPTHITSDGRDHILVTDSMNCRVQIFSEDGKYIGVIGEIGDRSGQLARPKGVAVDSYGHVYVLDAMADNLQIFDLQGQLLLVVGDTGTGPGQFWMPAGIAISRNNEIYVADSYNRRIEVFQYLGKQ